MKGTVFQGMIEQALLQVHTGFFAKVTAVSGNLATVQPLNLVKAVGGQAQKQAVIPNCHRLRYAECRLEILCIVFAQTGIYRKREQEALPRQSQDIIHWMERWLLELCEVLMKCFALDESGDVVLNQNDIQMAQGTDLIMQKIRQVLRTNRGEWSFDEKEGIPVRKILKKNPNIAMIRDYVRSVIDQVDGSLQMTRCDIATEGRVLKINFTVSGASGQTTAEMEV